MCQASERAMVADFAAECAPERLERWTMADELAGRPVELSLVPEPESAPPSFTELYTAEFGRLVRLATLLTGRPEAARDVVQDAFVRLHVKWASVRNPAAYVQRSVVNGCRSHHRQAARDAQRARAASTQVAAATALDVDHTFSTLAALSHRERAVVVLKFYEQRSEAEIAELVGCRPGSVGPTVQRALAKLRQLQ